MYDGLYDVVKCYYGEEDVPAKDDALEQTELDCPPPKFRKVRGQGGVGAQLFSYQFVWYSRAHEALSMLPFWQIAKFTLQRSSGNLQKPSTSTAYDPK
jgi:hypothetical protein